MWESFWTEEPITASGPNSLISQAIKFHTHTLDDGWPICGMHTQATWAAAVWHKPQALNKRRCWNGGRGIWASSYMVSGVIVKDQVNPPHVLQPPASILVAQNTSYKACIWVAGIITASLLEKNCHQGNIPSPWSSDYFQTHHVWLCGSDLGLETSWLPDSYARRLAFPGSLLTQAVALKVKKSKNWVGPELWSPGIP